MNTLIIQVLNQYLWNRPFDFLMKEWILSYILIFSAIYFIIFPIYQEIDIVFVSLPDIYIKKYNTIKRSLLITQNWDRSIYDHHGLILHALYNNGIYQRFIINHVPILYNQII